MRFFPVRQCAGFLGLGCEEKREFFSEGREMITFGSGKVRRVRPKMDFFDVVAARKSVRAFMEGNAEEEKLRRILETANQAPSAGNLQAYEIFVLRKAADRRALARAALGQEFVASAPVSLVFCANPGRAVPRYGQRGARLYALQDATIACTYAMLAATALGMATVWVGAFHDDEVRRAIRGPQDVLPVAILPIGYPAEKPERTSRRPLGDLIHEL
jgi:nitroreductase